MVANKIIMTKRKIQNKHV